MLDKLGFVTPAAMTRITAETTAPVVERGSDAPVDFAKIRISAQMTNMTRVWSP
jgi:hypothetical protein